MATNRHGEFAASVCVEDSVAGVVDAVASEAGKIGIRFLDYRCRVVPW
jgi:hypothetical protein